MKVTVGTFAVNKQMRERVLGVLDTGRISYGPMSREFEKRFADIHACNFAVLSNSGTSSLQVALQTLKQIHGWDDGDEVIVPSITFVATVNIVLHNKMKPVLCDVESHYYGIDTHKLDECLTDKTRVIIPVHLFGQPCDTEGVMEFAIKNRLAVIEDSCEAMFVSDKGRMVGSISDIGCFSTYVAHLLTTGVGGIATTNNPDYAATMRSIVNHGRDGIYISIDDDKDKDTLMEVVSRRFNFETIGHSYRITELEAALALGQLDDWMMMIAQRQHNASYLTEHLRKLEIDQRIQLPHTRPGAEHAFMMYPILTFEDKWPLCNYLEERGIETREMLRLTDQPCYSGMWNPEDYPVAELINRGGFYVGCHQGLKRDHLNWIVESLYEWYR